jgi:ketosteroid isomerase-like protein
VGGARDSGEVVPTSRASSAVANVEGFARALLGGDPTAAVAYFAADGQILTPDGTQLSGRASILAVLSQLTAGEPLLEIRSGRTVVADGVALSTQFWTRSMRTAPSEVFEANSVARFVLVRKSQGWQIAIAAPWS